MKRCSSCGQTKPPTEFHRDRSKKDGLAARCKPCVLEYVTEWKRARRVPRQPRTQATTCIRGHDLTVEANRRSGRWECAICHKERERERYRQNAEVMRRYARNYQRENRATRRAYHTTWRHANIEHVRAYGRMRQALRKLGKNQEALDYANVLRADPCSYCGERSGTVDHITAVEHGGTNDWANLTAACASCNATKWTHPLVIHLALR